jgi:putative transposase
MPRKTRDDILPNSIVHVTNRGNDRRIIFPQSIDYAAFLVLLREARERFAVKIHAFCLMPNHFHLVLWVADKLALSAYMQFVERHHSCDLRRLSGTRGQGHVLQREFWHRVIENDGQLLRVVRYVEANPVRACLVGRAELWEWSSLWDRETGERDDLLHDLPWYLPDGWKTIVNVPLEAIDVEDIRTAKPRRRAQTTSLRKA